MGIMDSLLGAVGLQKAGTAAAATPNAASTALPLDVQQWRSRIDGSRPFVKDIITQGKRHVNRYRMRHYRNPGMGAIAHDTVQAPIDFTKTETKRAQLFYRVPDVVLSGLNQKSVQVAPKFQAVVNNKLGPEHVNAKSTMDMLIFDVLCPTAFGAAKFGYETWTGSITNPDDPAQQMEVPAGGRYYAERIPPGRLLGPFAEFTGEDFDECDWLGMRFCEPAVQGSKGSTEYSAKDDDLLVDDMQQSRSRATKTVRWGSYVCYRARSFDPNVKNPNLFYEFELMDGDDAPRSHRPQPCPKVKGNTIKVLTIRYVSDTSFGPSDCAVTEVLADEQSRGRTQMMIQRERSLTQVMYDALRMKSDTLAKIERGEQVGMIGHDGPVTEDLVRVLEKGELPRESYTFNDVCRRDTDEAWGLGSNQSGLTTDTARTATELNLIENAKDTRLDYERDKIAAWFCNKFVRTIAGLLQHYAVADDVVPVVNAEGAQEFMVWNKDDVQGDFDFTIKINSQLRPDSAADRRAAIELANIAAKSPFINQGKLWMDVIRSYGRDPQEYMATPEPPKADPVLPSLKGDDLDPVLNPLKYANVFAICEKAGIQLPIKPDMAMIAALAFQAQTQAIAPVAPGGNPLTEGTADEADKLSKHVEDASGLLPGGGAMVAEQAGIGPMGPGPAG